MVKLDPKNKLNGKKWKKIIYPKKNKSEQKVLSTVSKILCLKNTSVINMNRRIIWPRWSFLASKSCVVG